MLKIGIIGEQCAGKTTVANMLIAGRVFRTSPTRSIIIKFADPIYRTMEVLGVNKNRGFMQDFSDVAKRYYGDDIFAMAFMRQAHEIMKADCCDLLLCDDIRYPVEMDAVGLSGFKTIYVTADESVRRSRAKATGLDFIEDHNSENQVAAIGGLADVCVDNSISDELMLESNLRQLQHKLVIN